MNEYLVEYEKTVTDLRNAGGKLEETEVVTQLLSGVPDRYQSVVTAIDVLFSKDPTNISLEFVKIKLLLEEQRQNANEEGEDPNSHAFVGHNGYRKFNSNSKRHNFRSDQRGSSLSVFKGKCFKCGGRGHKKYDCRQQNRVSHFAEVEEQEEISFVSHLQESQTHEENEDNDEMEYENIYLHSEENNISFIIAIY